ncbi:DUF2550 domain-containing protein [Micropruina sonneratiae]|uniref:DUF2550 domain-containing protein n=1 Tax=Micropruina sonneratiae TaxID=2986940 RepID=UPI002225E842|nr:DUF2550 domain-containing protein [Micropruina sp. KQZ13P-5]MCW3157542.1 DUF2550 domain-containing protein [Micropruina sp. KQZ13P-5]
MDVIGTVEAVLIVLFVLALVAVGWLWLRRRWLSRAGGAFACSLRRTRRTPGARWVLGVARYRYQELQWFPAFSLSLWPTLRFDRGAVRAGSQRTPDPDEAVDLLQGQRILGLHGTADGVELAMSPDSLTGLLSWLEASPPGMRYRLSPTSPD